MKIKIIVVALSIFLALIVSGCTDVEKIEKVVSENSDILETEKNFTVIEIQNSDGIYECEVRAPDNIEVNVRPIGSKAYIDINNQGNEDTYIEKIEVQIEEREIYNEIQVKRIISSNEKISIPLYTGQSSGWGFLEIHKINIITSDPPDE